MQSACGFARSTRGGSDRREAHWGGNGRSGCRSQLSNSAASARGVSERYLRETFCSFCSFCTRESPSSIASTEIVVCTRLRVHTRWNSGPCGSRQIAPNPDLVCSLGVMLSGMPISVPRFPLQTPQQMMLGACTRLDLVALLARSGRRTLEKSKSLLPTIFRRSKQL